MGAPFGNLFELYQAAESRLSLGILCRYVPACRRIAKIDSLCAALARHSRIHGAVVRAFVDLCTRRRGDEQGASKHVGSLGWLCRNDGRQRASAT